MTNLTPRQREIMTEVCAGNTAKEIARKLGINWRSVESHEWNIKKKLGARNLPHAVAMFMRTAATLLLFVTTAGAEWDGVKGPNSSWYDEAELTDAARQKFGFAKCCKQAEVLRTKFRYDGKTWHYLDGNTWRDIPEFIIWSGKQPPGNMPVLFIWNGQLTCFFEPDPET